MDGETLHKIDRVLRAENVLKQLKSLLLFRGFLFRFPVSTWVCVYRWRFDLGMKSLVSVSRAWEKFLPRNEKVADEDSEAQQKTRALFGDRVEPKTLFDKKFVFKMTQKSSGILEKTFYVYPSFFSYTIRQSRNISRVFFYFLSSNIFLLSADNQNFQLKSRFSSLLQQNTHSFDSIFHVTPTAATWWTWELRKSESRLTQITAAADTQRGKRSKRKMKRVATNGRWEIFFSNWEA